MTHDEYARELYQKEKDNITSVNEVLRGYGSDYYCNYCFSPVHMYGANYCYNCGKKLNWDNIVKVN